MSAIIMFALSTKTHELLIKTGITAVSTLVIHLGKKSIDAAYNKKQSRNKIKSA